MIGKSDDPLRDDWGEHAPWILYTSFARKPGRGTYVPGDEFVYHAIGQEASRVVAIGHVADEGFLDQKGSRSVAGLGSFQLRSKPSAT
jgi:hypothetical protein